MCFGLKAAPLIWCRFAAAISRVIAGMVRRAEMMSQLYLDDPLLIVAGSWEQRRYLITLEQFADVHAQENRIRPGGLEFPDDILDLAPGQQQTVIDGAYGAVVALDPVDGHPTFTFTAPTPPEQRPPAAPSAPYLATILHGLREVHDLDDTDIVERVGQSPGVRPNWSPAAMHQLLDTRLSEISST